MALRLAHVGGVARRTLANGDVAGQAHLVWRVYPLRFTSASLDAGDTALQHVDGRADWHISGDAEGSIQLALLCTSVGSNGFRLSLPFTSLKKKLGVILPALLGKLTSPYDPFWKKEDHLMQVTMEYDQVS